MTTERIELPLASTNACSCCATAPASAPHDSISGSESTTLLVRGMTCAHCVASVTEELTELDGVEGASVQLVAGGDSVVTVTTSAPVSDGALRGAVAAAGYEVASE